MGLIGEECLGVALTRLLHQGRVLRYEGLPFLRIRLEQPFLGTLEGESQPVQVVETSAAAQAETEVPGDVLADRFPVPVGQFDTRRCRSLLHRSLQLRLLSLAEGGGEPPDCSNIRAAGPPSPKAVAHLPMVWASRPSAWPVAEAVMPRYRSHRACHLLSLPKGSLLGRRLQVHPAARTGRVQLSLLQIRSFPPHTHQYPHSVCSAS